MTSVLPVLAGDMFETLGWGKGGTLLACIALVAVPAPALVSVHPGLPLEARGKGKYHERFTVGYARDAS